MLDIDPVPRARASDSSTPEKVDDLRRNAILATFKELDPRKQYREEMRMKHKQKMTTQQPNGFADQRQLPSLADPPLELSSSEVPAAKLLSQFDTQLQSMSQTQDEVHSQVHGAHQTPLQLQDPQAQQSAAAVTAQPAIHQKVQPKRKKPSQRQRLAKRAAKEKEQEEARAKEQEEAEGLHDAVLMGDS